MMRREREGDERDRRKASVCLVHFFDFLRLTAPKSMTPKPIRGPTADREREREASDPDPERESEEDDCDEEREDEEEDEELSS